MSDKKVTGLERALPISGSDVVHRVDVSDTSQSPDGSSYKNTFDDLENYFASVSDTVVGNAVLRGGVILVGDLEYYVWADKYIINNRVISIPISDTVTLNDGDGSNDRFDVFAVQITASEPPVPSIVVLEGTPAASPVKPIVDTATQAEISFRLVATGETQDTTTTIDQIYDENTGNPNEWDNDNTPTGGNLANTTDPADGTNHASIPQQTSSGDYFEWSDTVQKTFQSEDTLVFRLKFPGGVPGSIAATETIRIDIKIDDSGDTYSWLHTERFTASEVEGYAYYQIQLGDFVPTASVGSTYDRIRFTFYSTNEAYIDNIFIQSELGQPGGGTLGTIVRTKRVIVTAAELKVLGTSPKRLIDAPGTGLFVSVTHVRGKLTTGSTAFDSNTIEIKHEGATDAMYANGGAYIASATDWDCALARNNSIAAVRDMYVEDANVILSGTDSVATGDSELLLDLTYEIIKK